MFFRADRSDQSPKFPKGEQRAVTRFPLCDGELRRLIDHQPTASYLVCGLESLFLAG